MNHATTRDGRTRSQWRERLRAEGLPHREVEAIVAIAFGELPSGDRVLVEDADIPLR